MSRSADSLARVVDPLRARVKTARRWVEKTLPWRIWERLLENEFIDRSVAVGAKAFISFFPFVIVFGAFVGPRIRHSIVSTIESRFGLTGPSSTTVKHAFASSADIRKATGLLGLILLAFYATSFTNALQRLFTRAWRRPPGGKSVKRLRGLAFLGAIIAFAAILGGLRHILSGGPGTVAFLIVSAAVSVGLWWATSWLMLQGDVRWRPLFASGLITGLGLAIYAASAASWMPNAVASDQRQFGFFGVSLALVSWFTGAGFIIMFGACAAATLADESGKIGRLARGPGSSTLNPGAAPALGPPTRQPTLINAVGIHSGDEQARDADLS
jgi:membrane protein